MSGKKEGKGHGKDSSEPQIVRSARGFPIVSGVEIDWDEAKMEKNPDLWEVDGVEIKLRFHPHGVVRVLKHHHHHHHHGTITRSVAGAIQSRGAR